MNDNGRELGGLSCWVSCVSQAWRMTVAFSKPLSAALFLCGGLLGVAGRLSGTVSPFRAEQGIQFVVKSTASPTSIVGGSPISSPPLLRALGGPLMLTPLCL